MIIKYLKFCLLYIFFFFFSKTGINSNKNNLFITQFDTIVSCAPVNVITIKKKLKENSGLIFYKDLFWTFNDSGSKSYFYSLDSTNGKIAQKFVLADKNNIDWEDITQDDTHIYIGDFGNNFGSRKDLVIYKISKEFLTNAKNGMAWAEEIKFTYPEQKDFTHLLKGTEFDCEALTYYNGSLYLFTKDWINRTTRLYKLPTTPGNYKANLLTTFDVDGLITASAISPDGKMLALLGYKNYTPYLILFSDYEGNNFFNGKNIRLNFDPLHNTQTEGITFTANNIIYISSEKSKFPAQLFRLNIDKWNNGNQ